jgi:hypothetical protein
MAWLLEFDEQRNVICLSFSERVSYADVRDSSIAVISMIREKDVRNIMTDFTDVEQLDISIVGVFDLPDCYKRWGLSGSFTEALVRPTQSPVRDRIDFYETVCVNRGSEVVTFEDRTQALDWLVSNNALRPNAGQTWNFGWGA